MIMNLLRNSGYLGGRWKAAISKATFPVSNPANGKVITEVADMNEVDAKDAINAAHRAFKTWKDTTPKERSKLLRNWYNEVAKHQDDLAKLLTTEQGKPLAESQAEITYGNNYIELFSELATKVEGEILASPVKSKQLVVTRAPVGVAALITPWNFPVAMLTRKAAAAIAVGCTCVVKPAEDTPLTTLALADLSEKAGIPAGVFNVLPCSRKNTVKVGNQFTKSSLVSALSFTGSTAVGKILYRDCADTVKRLSLELGGNAPFLVFNSANINDAVNGAMISKFRNSGQTCICPNRFIIQDGIFDEFVGKLEEKMREITLGDGMQAGVKQGPIINDAQFDKIVSMVKDAVDKGAEVLCGGRPSPVGDRFYEPTILSNIKHSMECYNNEIFGPVVSLIRFGGEEEGVRLANDTTSGLCAYLFSNDSNQVLRVSEQLEVGMVGINEGAVSTAEAPFGGIKESGFGREGSKHGLDEFTYLKYRCIKV